MKVLIVIFICVFFISCNKRYYYLSDARNIPVLSKKGDYSLSTNYTIDNEGDAISSYSLVGSYAIKDNILATLSYQRASMDKFLSNLNGLKNDASGYIWEAGFGYYTNINKFNINLIMGAGTSNQNHEYNESGSYWDNNGQLKNYKYAFKSDIDLTKYYLQSDIVYKTNIINVALSNRLTKLNYFNATIQGVPSKEVKSELDLINNNHYIFIEPTLGIQAKITENYSLLLQVNYSYIHTGTTLKHSNGHYSFGFNYNFSK